MNVKQAAYCCVLWQSQDTIKYTLKGGGDESYWTLSYMLHTVTTSLLKTNRELVHTYVPVIVRISSSAYKAQDVVRGLQGVVKCIQ